MPPFTLARALAFAAIAALGAGVVFAIAAGCQNGPAPFRAEASVASVAIPGASPRDLRFSPALGSVLVPGGASGSVMLVDARLTVTTLAGFGSPVSVDEGAGWLLVADAKSQELLVAHPNDGRVVARAKLAGAPQLVRWVLASSEVWVTEPSANRVEVLRFATGDPPRVDVIATIATATSSLVVDATRARAYTNAGGNVGSLDAFTHAVVESWPSGCAANVTGLALDEKRGTLFVGCSDGSIAMLDVAHQGNAVGHFADDAGVGVIDYGTLLGHLYIVATANALDIATLDVEAGLAAIDRRTAPSGAPCIVADRVGNAFVCDPAGGSLVVVPDVYPRVDF